MLTVGTYFLVAVVVASLHDLRMNGIAGRFLRSLAIVLVPFLPCLLRRDAYSFVGAGLLVALLAVESAFPRIRYRFASNERVRTAAFRALLAGAGSLVAVLGLDHLSKQPVSWGLTAHHVPWWVQAPVAFFGLDFVMYVRHRCEHRFGFLWRFHQIHHAAEEFSVLALYGRFNVFETLILSHFLQALVVYLLGIRVDVYLYTFVLPFTFFATHFSHLNVEYPWKSSWLGNVFNNPAAHALHHSIEDDRRNYGLTLLVWDRLFGTYAAPGAITTTAFGTSEREVAHMGILGQHAYAFRGLLPRLRFRRAFGSSGPTRAS
jgi:sterol desaturase/sphingolipid hydroxylase (fatty acid hydroxylase superfamily)